MYATIKFDGVEVILLDLIDDREGFLFLRIVGPEVAVGAIWAKLSARDRKSFSGIEIKKPGRSYPSHINCEKGVRYRTLRSGLPNGMVDLAMLHPCLTVAEDNSDGFYILTYDDGTPSNFFERLNKTLSIPIKPEWADWLWIEGQERVDHKAIQTHKVWESGQGYVDEQRIDTVINFLINKIEGEVGEVRCYRVETGSDNRQGWLYLIRNHLGLQIDMLPQGHDVYRNGIYEILPRNKWDGTSWRLLKNGELIIKSKDLDWLLVESSEKLGLNLVIKEKN